MKPSSLLSLVAAIAFAASVPIASAETTPEAAAAQAGVDAGAEATARSAAEEKAATAAEQATERATEAVAAAPQVVRVLDPSEPLPWLVPSVGEGPQE